MSRRIHGQPSETRDKPTPTRRPQPRGGPIACDTRDDGRPAGEDQIVLHCTFWVPGPGTCGWTGKASQAGWCPHFEQWICPQCGASDGLGMVEDPTAPAPDAHREQAYEPQFEVEVV